MHAFGAVQAQRPGDGVQDAVRHTLEVAVLQPGAVLDADAREHRDLAAPQPRHPSQSVHRQPRLRGRDPVAAGAQERGGFSPVVHARQPRQAASVALRWLLQRGIPLVAKSTDPGRLRRNIAVFDFELPPDELAAIAQLDRHQPGLGFTHQDPRMLGLLLKYA
ncbi:aldo/keto reductase [Kitasatospora sp. NPDC048407]|uniref:aldo/keto reductase n=1 Tax=Kitasatospora sp. NPDC048407 TaxID=3364051 RepID=UPI003718E0C0